jgi:hypothetical protein
LGGFVTFAYGAVGRRGRHPIEGAIPPPPPFGRGFDVQSRAWRAGSGGRGSGAGGCAAVAAAGGGSGGQRRVHLAGVAAVGSGEAGGGSGAGGRWQRRAAAGSDGRGRGGCGCGGCDSGGRGSGGRGSGGRGRLRCCYVAWLEGVGGTSKGGLGKDGGEVAAHAGSSSSVAWRLGSSVVEVGRGGRVRQLFVRRHRRTRSSRGGAKRCGSSGVAEAVWQ